MSTTPPPIYLRNPMRYLVPIGTALLALLMFIPPILLTGAYGEGASIGIVVLAASVLWLLHSGWRAPHALVVKPDGVAVRRWSGIRYYSLDQIRRWYFAVPDGPPTQSPPPVNGVLYLTLDDRTRFRAEVTASEAAGVIAILPSDSVQK